MKRYEVRIGKFGQYFYDSEEDKDMSLDEVIAVMNEDSVEESKEYKYRVGDRFLRSGSIEYMLTQVENDKVTLVGLETGNRWTNPIKVKLSDDRRITEEDLKRLSGNNGNFKLKD